MWPWPRPLFEKFLTGLTELSLETCLSNVKSAALSILELLAFNIQIFRGSRDPGHAPFGKIVKIHVRNVPGNTCVKFEVRSSNRFGAIWFAFNSYFKLVWLTGPLRTDRQTDRHTSKFERIHHLRHSLRSLGGDNNEMSLQDNKKIYKCLR